MEKRADFFRRPTAGVVHKMGVAPRHGRCRVAEQVGYGQFPFPGKRQPAGVGVAQRVEDYALAAVIHAVVQAQRGDGAVETAALLARRKKGGSSARSAAEAPRKRGGVRNAHSRTAHAVIAG